MMNEYEYDSHIRLNFDLSQIDLVNTPTSFRVYRSTKRYERITKPNQRGVAQEGRPPGIVRTTVAKRTPLSSRKYTHYSQEGISKLVNYFLAWATPAEVQHGNQWR